MNAFKIGFRLALGLFGFLTPFVLVLVALAVVIWGVHYWQAERGWENAPGVPPWCTNADGSAVKGCK
jgi:hypothetical protein